MPLKPFAACKKLWVFEKVWTVNGMLMKERKDTILDEREREGERSLGSLCCSAVRVIIAISPAVTLHRGQTLRRRYLSSSFETLRLYIQKSPKLVKRFLHTHNFKYYNYSSLNTDSQRTTFKAAIKVIQWLSSRDNKQQNNQPLLLWHIHCSTLCIYPLWRFGSKPTYHINKKHANNKYMEVCIAKAVCC